MSYAIGDQFGFSGPGSSNYKQRSSIGLFEIQTATLLLVQISEIFFWHVGTCALPDQTFYRMGFVHDGAAVALKRTALTPLIVC
jgi:hypothetical protein